MMVDDTTTSTVRGWTFLSNHAHVLVCLAQDPEQRIRDIASRVGITERATSNIVRDLETDGYLTKRREGRSNRYTLDTHRPLRHPIEEHRSIGDLLGLIQ